MNKISITTTIILSCFTLLVLAGYKSKSAANILVRLIKFLSFLAFWAFSCLILIFYIFLTFAVSNFFWGIIVCPIILLLLLRSIEKIYEHTAGLNMLSLEEKNFVISCATFAIVVSSIVLCIKNKELNYAIIGCTVASIWIGFFVPLSSIFNEKNKMLDIIKDVYKEILIFKDKKNNFFTLILSTVPVLLLIIFDIKEDSIQNFLNSVGKGIGCYFLIGIVFTILYLIFTLVRKKVNKIEEH